MTDRVEQVIERLQFELQENCLAMPNSTRDAILRAIEALSLSGIEPTEALDWLASETGLELSYGEIDGDLSECAWRVHRCSGGYNDREWTLIATGETPQAALESARQKGEGGAD